VKDTYMCQAMDETFSILKVKYINKVCAIIMVRMTHLLVTLESEKSLLYRDDRSLSVSL
jgi:hypothetical protein